MLLKRALHGAFRLLQWRLAALLTLGLPGFSVCGGDWAQYRGPTHDGVSNDRIIKQWSGSVTNPIWRVPVPNGLSSFAVSGGRAVTQVRRTIDSQDMEVCVALDIKDGSELWAATIDSALYDGGVGYDDGPRSTPTVDSDSVYILSSHLKLFRLNATNGSVIWQKDLVALYGSYVIAWQNAASPLLENGLLYVNASTGDAALMSFRASDGSLAWRAADEWMTHSTPTLATISGVRQVIFAAQSGLVSVDALSGALLWRAPYPFSYNTSLGASPVVSEDMIFVTGAHAYNMGSLVVQASFTNSTWTATQLWFTNNPASHWMTPVVYQGFLYGLFGIQQFDVGPSTQFKCIDMRTGEVKWSTNNFGHGGTLLVDNHLVIVTEKGELVLAQPDPTAYIELGRFLAIPDYFGDTNKCWNSPAVADGRVYVRSTSFGACFDLSIPALKLDPPVAAPANKFQLTVRTATGAQIDSNRMAGMQILSATNPALAPLFWSKLTNTLTLINGTVRVTNIDGNASPKAFFRASETNQ